MGNKKIHPSDGRYHSGSTPSHPAGKVNTGGDKIGGKNGSTNAQNSGKKFFGKKK